MKSIYMIVFLFHILTSLVLAEEVTGNRACSDEQLLRSLPAVQLAPIVVPVEFINQRNNSVTIYWLNYAGERVWYYNLAAQSSYYQNTFANQPWIIIDGNNNCLGIYVVESGGSTQKVIIKESSTIASNIEPVANFTMDTSTGTVPLVVNLNASASTDTDGHIVEYKWVSSDGQEWIANEGHAAKNVAMGGSTPYGFTFNHSGTFTITLTVTDEQGATDTQKKTVIVSAPQVSNIAPVASFTTSLSTGTAPLLVNLNASGSVDSDGSISSYVWSSSDGQTTSGQATNLTFIKAGSVVLTLTITDNQGAIDTQQKTVTVKAQDEDENKMTWKVTDKINDGENIQYTFWKLVDGKTSTSWGKARFITSQFNQENTTTLPCNKGEMICFGGAADDDISWGVGMEGRQSVCTECCNICNGGTYSYNVTLIADFSLTLGSATATSRTINLNASGSTDSEGNIVRYTWSNSDGQVATGKIASFRVSQSGNYKVTLTVTNSANTTTHTSKTIFIDMTNPSIDLGNASMSIAAGLKFTLALKEDGSVWAWGENDKGQLGVGTFKTALTPIQVVGLNGVVQISAGESSSLALTKNGKVYSWGSNSIGQLGDGLNINKNLPALVQNLPSIISVAAAHGAALALAEDGTVWAWGSGNRYIFGFENGSRQNRSTPTQVRGLNKVKAISLGNAAIALKADGTVWSWGLIHKNAVQKTPIQVQGLNSITSVWAGYLNSYAINSAGDVFGWGDHRNGKLGEGVLKSSFIPILIDGLSDIKSISSTGSYTFAITKNNTMLQIGISKKIPVEYLNDIVSVSTSNFQTVILKTDGAVWSWRGYPGDGGSGRSESSSFGPTKAQDLILSDNMTPIAAFTLIKDGDEDPLVVSLDASISADIDGSIVQYQWSTSDNQTSTGKKAIFTFSTPGDFSIDLTVTDNEGWQHTSSQSIIVKRYKLVNNCSIVDENLNINISCAIYNNKVYKVDLLFNKDLSNWSLGPIKEQFNTENEDRNCVKVDDELNFYFPCVMVQNNQYFARLNGNNIPTWGLKEFYSSSVASLIITQTDSLIRAIVINNTGKVVFLQDKAIIFYSDGEVDEFDILIGRQPRSALSNYGECIGEQVSGLFDTIVDVFSGDRNQEDLGKNFNSTVSCIQSGLKDVKEKLKKRGNFLVTIFKGLEHQLEKGKMDIQSPLVFENEPLNFKPEKSEIDSTLESIREFTKVAYDIKEEVMGVSYFDSTYNKNNIFAKDNLMVFTDGRQQLLSAVIHDKYQTPELDKFTSCTFSEFATTDKSTCSSYYAQCTYGDTTAKSKCDIENGRGFQTALCASNGYWGKYNNCTPSYCNKGFEQQGDQCLETCILGDTDATSCNIDNGKGSKTRACTTDGFWENTFGRCIISSCNIGFEKSGNKCEKKPSSTTTPTSIGTSEDGSSAPDRTNVQNNQGSCFVLHRYTGSTPCTDSSSGSDGGSGSGSGSKNYTYSCQNGSSKTALIPISSCRSKYEDFTYAFGCNEVKDFYRTCVNLYTCLGSQVNLKGCDSYKR
ncbi:MAG: PKD domain-containing protein [Methyloprofundus sp.]|nr:PKD domain-containing protein [Methyloprofundus sp.]